MGMRFVRTQHAFCDGEGCGAHVFMVDCVQDVLIDEVRRSGWSFNCQTKTLLCPECYARKQATRRGEAARYMRERNARRGAAQLPEGDGE